MNYLALGGGSSFLASLKRFFFCILVAGFLANPAWPQQKTADLANQSIDDLMNIEVTSVSKKEQRLSQVAAAVFVITQEDIRRSGATNIPDLLRMVPGLDVAQINSNTWAITARGFNSQFANKLLVLVDGRAVYTPLFGGVNWDTQDVPLEDIDRIEVIRGPGGTVWGANAVNGVINVITKKAEETQGALLTAGGGTLDQAFGTAQYGGKMGETTYRAFTKYLDYDHLPDLNGQDSFDGWHLLHGGFRADTTISGKDFLTLQGDLYSGSEGATIVHSIVSPPANINLAKLADLSGGNIEVRWNHEFSSRSDITVQSYFDRYIRTGPEASEVRNTVDLDFQHHLVLGTRQDLIYGGGFRHSDDQTVGTIDQAFVPADESGQLFSAFVQDQITLKPKRVFLYLGTKLENSYFSGFDLQPSVRLAWTFSPRQTFWTAVSRATRTPTQRDIGLDAVLAALPGPAVSVLLGNPAFRSEHVIAYEAGYRAQPSERGSIDVSVFFNTYQDLKSTEPGLPFLDSSFTPPLLTFPQSFANKLYGTTEGVEIFSNWKVTDRWTMSPGYSFFEMHLHTDPSSLDTTSVPFMQGSSPNHQAELRSRFNLSRHFIWDTNAYFVDSLPAQLIPSYTRLDTQLVWRKTERVQFSVVGQNLLQDHHPEYNDVIQSVNSAQVKRSVYAKVSWICW